jgi:phosphotransferase system HPr-like phosphotransfer protein
MKKYFSVKTKCGHVGKFRCVWIDFAVVAENAKEAAEKVKKYSRVKRHQKSCIESVTEIDFENFMMLKAKNDADPYLHCKSIQEQRAVEGFEDRIEVDEYNIAKYSKKVTKKESLEYRVKREKVKENSQKRALREYFYGEAIV